MEHIDIKKIGVEFGHWILLGVSIIFILLVFIFSGDSKIQTMQANLEKSWKALQAAVAENKPATTELPNYKEKIAQNWNPIRLANTPFLKDQDIKEKAAWLTKLRDAPDPISALLQQGISKDTQQQLLAYKSEEPLSETFFAKLLQELNFYLMKTPLYDVEKAKEHFGKITLRPETKKLINTPNEEIIRVNRAILEDVYPQEIAIYTRMGQEYFYEEMQIKFKEAFPPTQQWIAMPKNVTIQVDREKITLSWDAPEAPLDAAGKEKKLTDIAGYHLQKRWNADGKDQEEIIPLEGVTTTTYEDTKVESKIDYLYALRSYTLNTEAQGGKLVDFDAKKVVVSQYTPEQKGTILPSYRMKLLGVSEDTAFLELSKWEKGDWRTISLYLKKGQKIERKVYVKELKRMVDFSPGWKLVSVNSKAIQEMEITKHIMIINPETKQPGRAEAVQLSASKAAASDSERIIQGGPGSGNQAEELP